MPTRHRGLLICGAGGTLGKTRGCFPPGCFINHLDHLLFFYRSSFLKRGEGWFVVLRCCRRETPWWRRVGLIGTAPAVRPRLDPAGVNAVLAERAGRCPLRSVGRWFCPHPGVLVLNAGALEVKEGLCLPEETLLK